MDSVSLSKEHKTYTQTDCNDIGRKPHNLVTNVYQQISSW